MIESKRKLREVIESRTEGDRMLSRLRCPPSFHRISQNELALVNVSAIMPSEGMSWTVISLFFFRSLFFLDFKVFSSISNSIDDRVMFFCFLLFHETGKFIQKQIDLLLEIQVFELLAQVALVSCSIPLLREVVLGQRNLLPMVDTRSVIETRKDRNSRSQMGLTMIDIQTSQKFPDPFKSIPSRVSGACAVKLGKHFNSSNLLKLQLLAYCQHGKICMSWCPCNRSTTRNPEVPHC
ncbi:hypothetical protein VP01_6465g1 [Puccinia sorghi]|uniref:Uncharacterized protein n=1 Tax=Puccinia sorghi TaxID=27349 RepID=A0A0L6UFQ3_9BASI|nr:hypothetical protein VP01_6465g1 [Puccinia sorghi]